MLLRDLGGVTGGASHARHHRRSRLRMSSRRGSVVPGRGNITMIWLADWAAGSAAKKGCRRNGNCKQSPDQQKQAQAASHGSDAPSIGWASTISERARRSLSACARSVGATART